MAVPRDEVVRSSVSEARPAPSGPWAAWAEMESLGLLGGGAPGPKLTTTARQGLLEALERMEAGGVKLAGESSVPWSREVRLTPRKALKRLENREGVRAWEPGQEGAWELKGLSDVRALDAAHGAGPGALGQAGASRMEALLDLQKAGASFHQNRREGMGCGVAQAFRRLEAGDGLSCRVDGLACEILGDEQVLSLAFFRKDGADRGLARPELARGLRSLASHGLELESQGGATTPRSVYLAGCKDVAVRRPKSDVLLPIREADLQDLDALEARLAEFDGVISQVVSPLPARGFLEGCTRLASRALGSEDFGLDLKPRCELFAELYQALPSEEIRDSDKNLVALVVDVMRALHASGSSAPDVSRHAQMILPVLKSDGSQAAIMQLGRIQEFEQANAGQGEDGRFAEEAFTRILAAMGSVDAALEGVELVRTPVGSETAEERLGIFLRLLKGLSGGHQQDRAFDVFGAVQVELKAGRVDVAGAGAMVDRFMQGFVLSDSVDRALVAMRSEQVAPSSAIAPGDEFVDIGGVRLPRRS